LKRLEGAALGEIQSGIANVLIAAFRSAVAADSNRGHGGVADERRDGETGAIVAAGVPLAWQIARVGDVDGDGKIDLAWHTERGEVAVWLMDGTKVKQSSVVSGAMPLVCQFSNAFGQAAATRPAGWGQA